MIGLRLFLPESWTGDVDGWQRPACRRIGDAARTKPEIALGRDRSHPDRGRRLCNGSGGCWIRPFRVVPPGARCARLEVGGRNSQAAESLPEQRQTGLSDRGTRTATQAPTSRINSPCLRKTCSPTQSGDASAGVKEPKGLWRRPSPPCACASPMVRHNASTRRACSTCRARRPGWSASGAPRASANTIFPTCLPTPASRRSPPRSRRDGSASKPTSSSRKNSASITSRADPAWPAPPRAMSDVAGDRRAVCHSPRAALSSLAGEPRRHLE